MQPSHYWGEDLELGPTGDLARVEATDEGKQRVLRRLLTPPRDLIFHPEYGAGLPGWIGETRRVAELRSLITSQLHLEAVVSDDPQPTVTTSPTPDSLFVQIQYTDAVTRRNEILPFDVDR